MEVFDWAETFGAKWFPKPPPNGPAVNSDKDEAPKISVTRSTYRLFPIV